MSVRLATCRLILGPEPSDRVFFGGGGCKIRFGDCRSIRFSSPFIHNECTFPKAMNGLCRILRVKVKLRLRTP